MNPTTLTITIIAIILLIALIAWLLYRAGFKVKEVTAKAGPLEAKMERETGPDPPAETQQPRTEAAQEALQGGRIKDSKIKAPPETSASLKQKAEGKDSAIEGSDIELKE